MSFRLQTAAKVSCDGRNVARLTRATITVGKATYNGLAECRYLRTDTDGKAGVFDVDARKVLAIRCEECGAHVELGIGT